MSRRSAVVVLAFVAGLAAACRPVLDTERPSADYPCLQPSDSIGNRALQPPGYFWTIDDSFAELARTVPGGFGGMFSGQIDGRGKPATMNFYLKDLSKAEAAARVLGYSSWNALQGQYDYLELKSCYQGLRNVDFGPLLGQIRMSDIDESRNRIVLGIASLFAERISARRWSGRSSPARCSCSCPWAPSVPSRESRRWWRRCGTSGAARRRSAPR